MIARPAPRRVVSSGEKQAKGGGGGRGGLVVVVSGVPHHESEGCVVDGSEVCEAAVGGALGAVTADFGRVAPLVGGRPQRTLFQRGTTRRAPPKTAIVRAPAFSLSLTPVWFSGVSGIHSLVYSALIMDRSQGLDHRAAQV